MCSSDLPILFLYFPVSFLACLYSFPLHPLSLAAFHSLSSSSLSVCLFFFSISIFCSVLLFSYFPLITAFFCLSRFCQNISVPSLLSKESVAFPLLLILLLSLLLILFLINLHLPLSFPFSLSSSPF